jgi:hypothetical protein
MADTQQTTATFEPKEKTFRNFTTSQADNYSQHRRNYHPSVYQHVLSQHTSTGGDLNHVLDVGWQVSRVLQHTLYPEAVTHPPKVVQDSQPGH